MILRRNTSALLTFAVVGMILAPVIHCNTVKEEEPKKLEQHSGWSGEVFETLSSSDVSFFQVFGRSYAIDRFERSKNAQGSRSSQGMMPLTDLNFWQAKNLCSQSDGRLCTYREWSWACSIAVSQKNDDCHSEDELHPAGIYCPPDGGAPADMLGNAREWTVGPFGNAMIVGSEKCEDGRRSSPFKKSAELGVRCCYGE